MAARACGAKRIDLSNAAATLLTESTNVTIRNKRTRIVASLGGDGSDSASLLALSYNRAQVIRASFELILRIGY